MINTYLTLKLVNPMMEGSTVVRFQEMADLLGFDAGENDGIFNQKTEDTVIAIQRKYGLLQDGVCGPKTWEIMLTVLNSLEKNKIGNSFSINDGVYDIRKEHSHPKLYKCKRDWTAIDGVTLHQTGCNMPSNPLGWSKLNAHIGVTQEGKVIIVNDPTDFIWHAQKLSRSTIGIEIEGNYCGIDGNLKTLWKGGGGPDHLNDRMMMAFRRLFVWLHVCFTNQDKLWLFVFAHRQSKDTRIADPGEEIWKKVAIPWMNNLGIYDISCIKHDKEYKLGSGRPIPKEWDSNRKAKYWD